MKGGLNVSVKKIGDLFPKQAPAPEPTRKPYKVCYHLVVEDHYTDIENRVNRLLAQGWQPLGGIAMCQKSGTATGLRYIQAVIRY